jgi:8-oxo-dGTP diphosphatase
VITPAAGGNVDPSQIDPGGDVEVWAAGGVVRRGSEAGEKILLVHRPHRRDWSLPKGKVDPGESLLGAAVREIREETGFVCDLAEVVAVIRYRDAADRRKLVVYFDATVVDGAFVPNDEVDEIRWCTRAEAELLLTYPRDRRVVAGTTGC